MNNDKQKTRQREGSDFLEKQNCGLGDKPICSLFGFKYCHKTISRDLDTTRMPNRTYSLNNNWLANQESQKLEVNI